MQPCGAAPARDSQSRPGGPGRPSGFHYGEPAIDGRHGRNERQGESLRIAGLSETVRGQKPPQKQRRRLKACLRRGAPPGVCAGVVR